MKKASGHEADPDVGYWRGSTPQCEFDPEHDLDGEFLYGPAEDGTKRMMCLGCHQRHGSSDRLLFVFMNGLWTKLD